MKCLCNGKNYQLLIYLVFQLFPPQQTVSGNILQSETAVRDNYNIITVIWYVSARSHQIIPTASKYYVFMVWSGIIGVRTYEQNSDTYHIYILHNAIDLWPDITIPDNAHC